MTSKRTISATNETGFLQKKIKPVLFCRLDFSSGVQRYHSEIGPKTATHPVFGAEAYTGIGDFGGINGGVRESVSGAPIGLKLVLTGVNSTLINKAFVDDYFRRDADLMIGLEDDNGDLLDDPEVLFSGYMDSVSISLSHRQGIIEMALESRGTNLLSASDWRFTDEDLQAEYAGDLAGEYIYRMVDLKIRWGATGVVGSGIVRPRYPSTPPWKEPGIRR